jgi:erythromycin esterase-like protein
MTDAELVRKIAQPFAGETHDYDALLQLIGDARFVLIGEASHGTHEFYFERAVITKQLIVEKGFSIVAIEADWPDAARVHRYVRGTSLDANGNEALLNFRRFPIWMWRNKVVLDFVEWLRGFNSRPDRKGGPVGFYGMDLYSLHASIDAVLRYLDKVDPDAAARARLRYSCFDHFGHDPQEYGYAATVGATESCESAVLQQLTELQQNAVEFSRRDGQVAADEFFFAEQNARLVKDAEKYYRAMFRGRASCWNLRDQHMAETLENLLGHLNGSRQPKMIVWAHNSHLGDARATEMSLHGELNVGQLIRERFSRDVVLIGFSTHHGTVTAASDWDGPAERKNVRPALPGSYEDLFHQTGLPRFWIDLRTAGRIGALQDRRIQRAIGVIYRPETERLSHYFRATLPQQFDAFIHIDETRALDPLESTTLSDQSDLPETYPFNV